MESVCFEIVYNVNILITSLYFLRVSFAMHYNFCRWLVFKWHCFCDCVHYFVFDSTSTSLEEDWSSLWTACFICSNQFQPNIKKKKQFHTVNSLDISERVWSHREIMFQYRTANIQVICKNLVRTTPKTLVDMEKDTNEHNNQIDYMTIHKSN